MDKVATDNEDFVDVPKEIIKVPKKVQSDKLSHKEKKKLKKEVSYFVIDRVTQIIAQTLKNYFFLFLSFVLNCAVI